MNAAMVYPLHLAKLHRRMRIWDRWRLEFSFICLHFVEIFSVLTLVSLQSSNLLFISKFFYLLLFSLHISTGCVTTDLEMYGKGCISQEPTLSHRENAISYTFDPCTSFPVLPPPFP